MLIIDLIPKMASLFNDFMIEYSKKVSEKTFETSQMFALHSEMINAYSLKAIKLAMQYVDNEEIEANFNNWLEKHGGK